MRGAKNSGPTHANAWNHRLHLQDLAPLLGRNALHPARLLPLRPHELDGSAFEILIAEKASPMAIASSSGASHRGRAAMARNASPGAMKTSSRRARSPRS
jgi:hypothetical protein